ncbi:MAG: DMT family transporter [Planctomycetes bacterium]|nr:DMT family transporter [Planctomycetota bacterium]
MAESEAFDSETGREPMGVDAALWTLLTAALWGGTPVAISYSVDQLPPVAVAGLRFAMASAFMLVWCRAEGSRLALRPGEMRWVLGGAALLFVQISLFNLGVAKSNSSHGSVLVNTFVLWVVVIEHFLAATPAERLTARKVGGLAFAAAGGLILMLAARGETALPDTRDQATLAGDLILLLCAFILGIKIVYTKAAVKRLDPGRFILWHDVLGVVLFAAWSFAFEDVSFARLQWPTIWGLVYQGVVVAGFCFAVQALLLRKHPASQIAIYSTATPLFGIAFAALFRGDRLSPWLILAGVCVAAGILLVNLAGRRGQTPLGASDAERGESMSRKGV